MKNKNELLSTNDQKQLDKVTSVIKEELGDSLTGLYLYGSATQKGLNINSDLDLLSITSESISLKTKLELTKKIMNVSRKINSDEDLRYIELTNIVSKDISPWEHPVYQDFIYGEWLREDYEAGSVSEREKNPDVTILLYQVKQQGISLFNEADFEFPDIPFNDIKKAMLEMIPIIVDEVVGDESNVILTLCRILYTLETKIIVAKDIAADNVKPKFSLDCQKIIESAAEEYTTGTQMIKKSEEILKTVNSIKEAILYVI